MASSCCSKKVKVREAIIADEKEELQTTIDRRQSLIQNIGHLETKRKIEDLREQFGPDWLRNQSGTKGVVGFESDPNQKSKTKEFIENILNESDMSSSTISAANEFQEPPFSSTPIADTPLLLEQTGITEYESAEDTLPSVYQSASDVTLVENSFGSEPEDDEDIYSVINEATKEELFLILTERNIRERDVLDARTVTKWSIKLLESCERPRSDVIVITFDIMKKDKKRREYTVPDKNECQRLESMLRGIISKRPLSEMNQKLYRCAVCNLQFSREQKFHMRETTCPDCKSSYVIEITETPKKYSPDLKMEEKLRHPVAAPGE